jgi:hypothetical protein
MDLTNLENGMNEREALDNDTRKVVQLLSALPRVEAPGDFEFGVKAKIAAGNSRSRSGLFSFLKVAAPLSLILVIGAFVMYYGTLPGNESVATVNEVPAAQHTAADNHVQPPVGEVTREAPAQVSGPRVAENDEPQVAAVSSDSRRTTSVRRSDRSERAPARQGSFDISVSPGNVITAPGFESDLGRNSNDNSGSAGVSGVTVREVFEILGMKGDFVDGGWRVSSTSENSIAARSGIRSNDIIESVDGRTLSASTKLKGNFEGKSVSVRREGKQLRLDLKN